jgi:putative drug exporter of the RND superfamily
VFDAFAVRMVLVPALLYLMGDRVWWLPRWLDRLLPNVGVEGERLQRAHLARDRELADELEELEELTAEHSRG